MDGERDDRRSAADGPRGRDTSNRARDARRDAYVADISARLRHVCQHLTDAEFTSLVLDMAATRLRFADIEGEAFRRGPRGTVDEPDAP